MIKKDIASDLNMSHEKVSGFVYFNYVPSSCLVYFKLCCLGRILSISWEIRILNFIKIVQYFSIEESVVRSKFVPDFFAFFVFFGIPIEIVSNYTEKFSNNFKVYIEIF